LISLEDQDLGVQFQFDWPVHQSITARLLLTRKGLNTCSNSYHPSCSAPTNSVTSVDRNTAHCNIFNPSIDQITKLVVNINCIDCLSMSRHPISRWWRLSCRDTDGVESARDRCNVAGPFWLCMCGMCAGRTATQRLTIEWVIWYIHEYKTDNRMGDLIYTRVQDSPLPVDVCSGRRAYSRREGNTQSQTELSKQ
jgi:hypothetical protein